MNRRTFLASVGGSALLAQGPLLPRALGDMASEIAEYKKPVFNLHQFFSAPVKIESIDLLQFGNLYFVRTRSTDGGKE